jgi:hypothetical protein
MSQVSHSTKRLISTGLLVVFVFGLSSVGVLATRERVQAQKADNESIVAIVEAAAGASEGSCSGMSPCPGKGIKENLRTISGKIISPAFRIALIQALLNLSQFVLDRLAYEAAVAIASGGPGEGSLFYKKEPAEAFKTLGLEVAGEAVGMLSELSSKELGIKYNICDPGEVNPAVSLMLAIGIKQKYKPAEPKCDIMEVGANWSAFFTNAYQTISDPQMRKDAILSKFAESLKPGNNELTATLRLNIAIDEEVREAKLTQFLQQNEKEYKPVTDFISGNVKTPSATLQQNFETQLEKAGNKGEQIKVGELVNAGELIGGLALTTASTFTNTLLSTLLNRVYTGLFDTESDAIDPFNIETPGGGGREAAQERFASIIATNPIATTEYNALSDFVVCTAEGVTNRGLYNCVMDVNFLAAVSRGTSGAQAAVTVQEAIDEGLLNGDWPVIGPDNLAANQDPLCYTYGYCYGNLVKLRKARVIPVGWEFAALRNDVNNPATLQEVIDGFNNCTEDGTIGPASATNSDSKWCHLIDPNWVLKYPETQCRAVGIGDIRLSTLSPGRNSSCVDAPSCIGENNDGECADGYGYCVQEKNVWRFRGDECPEQYATCLAFKNVDSGENVAYLVNSVDYSVCNQNNAGCLWYRTGKYLEDAGTALNVSDDTYEWLPTGEVYDTAARENDWQYQNETSGAVARVSYPYTSVSGETYTYATYAYEDRIYLTNNVSACGEDEVGCTRLFEFNDDVTLNLIQNPSFEDDEDADDFPDQWMDFTPVASTQGLSAGAAQYGQNVFETDSSQVSQVVSLNQNNFYTLSFYAKASLASGVGSVAIVLRGEDGKSVSTAGASFGGDCVAPVDLPGVYQINNFSPSTWTRFDCTFTAPSGTDSATIGFIGNDLLFDAFQLEVGENVSSFTEGYSRSPRDVYYKVAPSYLGCEGNATDPAACGDYALACSPQDVGCNLYTPQDGDPSVPAIISSLDVCPGECIGYTTYKQEATEYESEDFPLYFISDKATQCSSQFVGCSSFTNLGSESAGGEAVEYYKDLRFCLSPSIADGSNTQKTPATFFTWEGSDNAGYQLQTWYLLESNTNLTTETFVGDPGITEARPDLAPCTHIEMSSEDEVLCNDTSLLMSADVWANWECDEHDDIFDNPDCREFFDTVGNIHYREYSDTISISEECVAYRKDVSNEEDCEILSGGYWTDQGFCRYYVLPSESESCPAEQNGCREYTGGAGRNASTILSENFEGGTYDDFVMAEVGGTTSLSISNESLATNGHSLRVLAPSAGAGGFETTQISLGEVFDNETTCTLNGGVIVSGGCEINADVNDDGSFDETCVVADGQESCGVFTNSLVGGKTFVVEFWAKGSGNLYVTFVENGSPGITRDMVDPENNTSSSPDSLTLTGAWRLYSLGPLDTSSFEDFDENAVLRFTTTEGEQFYIDNLSLKQVEENITIIKDSWVVPSTCDANLSDENPGQYLGCEAYDDKDGNEVNLYQFSDLCSEDSVGCEGFYHTYNSESPYQEIYNARCVYSNVDKDLTDGEIVTTNTPCVVDGRTYCTIAVGESYCTFDVEQKFTSPLPLDDSATPEIFGIVYGPETVVARADGSVYLVADDDFACGESAMGCQEFGRPTFNQDQSRVVSFESVYFINQPEEYSSTLCDNEALFCAEWSSTQDGNFYFKDPLDKGCEYKTSVTISNHEYKGWFRTGTNEPCDSEYLIAGEEYGIWRNGDEQYVGWVANCGSQYDLCSEFIDVVDTSGGSSTDEGMSYYFTNDELLSEDTLTDSQRCNGSVSQKFGCALFNNTTVSDLNYNASASYVASTHADILFGEEPNSLQDPINCDIEGGGEFEISESDAQELGLDGVEVDLCSRRCVYTIDSDDSLETSGAQRITQLTGATHSYFERSCLEDSDCPIVTSRLGVEVDGTCRQPDDYATTIIPAYQWSVYALSNDTNEVLKVNRDRTCSAWLACETSKNSWNMLTNRYDSICESINLCVEGTQQGDSAMCTHWIESESEVLDAYEYSARDVNWTGYEFSGNSIPNQLPIDLYDQFNISAQAVCRNPTGHNINNDIGLPIACDTYEDCPHATMPPTSCTTNSQCTGAGYGGCDSVTLTCFYSCEVSNEVDNRLAYNAGPCDSTEAGDGNGGGCVVGHCEESGIACASEDDCDSSDSCVVGYCQVSSLTSCGANSTCPGVLICDIARGMCVDQLIPNEDTCVTNDDCGAISNGAVCVPSAASTIGSCFNNRCLSDSVDENADGHADPLNVDDAREMACRSYPEIDSPFPPDVVSEWVSYEVGQDDYTSNVSEVDSNYLPYQYANGFQDSTVCGIEANGSFADCVCSYDKAEYGQGIAYRYYEIGTGMDSDDIPRGVCSGGPRAGTPCISDDECSEGEQAGTCTYLSRVDSVYGWPGFCIERDTSIQTMGSTDQDNQACLSWLPVDQLTGATDLYGKFTSAGFALSNTYYCAEIRLAYNIRTTSIGCASDQDNDCNDVDWDAFRDEADNIPEDPGDIGGGEDDCIAAVWCPNGFFAVMTGCGDQSVDPDGDGEMLCENETNVPDCPFFCVPKYSYKTQADGGGEVDDECSVPSLPNSDTSHISKSYIIEIQDVDEHIMNGYNPTNLGEADIRIFVLRPDSFETAIDYYDDCLVRGVLENASEYYLPQGGFNDLLSTQEPSGPATRGYYGLHFDIDSYAACASIAQVSSKSLEDDNYLPFDVYNSAWTDRNWGGTQFSSIENTENDDLFGYTYQTAIAPYGSALDYEVIEGDTDPYPHEVIMCEDTASDMAAVVAPAVNACPTGSAQEGNDARAFMDVEITGVGNAPLGVYCINADCSCEYTVECNDGITCSNFVCNNDNSISCVTDLQCPDSECVGECVGHNDGQDCTSVGQCQVNYCNQNDECRISEPQNIATFGLAENDSPQDAVDRLGQIFGKVYRLFTFSDGYESVSAITPGNMDFGLTRGSFTDVSPSVDWDWDVRLEGDGVENPDAPTVASVGNCSGFECYEGEENAFSVNSTLDGNLEGEGSLMAFASFFVYADSNQMPLRRVIVDWGDDFTGAASVDVDVWPTGNQSGSTAQDNFYKNNRGLDMNGNEMCSGSTEFGKTSDACTTGYVNFSHGYVCTPGRLEILTDADSSGVYRECIIDETTGRLVNSPCTGGDVGEPAVDACVFQPRVHAMDNWGWCTGECENGSVDPSEDERCWGVQECEVQQCPGGNDCIDQANTSYIDNPWVNWGGYIIVSPD